MTQALRYALLGFLTALTLQLFRDPPAWALLVAFWIGMSIGIGTTALMFWVDDVIVEITERMEK